jgi:hypothetical protein
MTREQVIQKQIDEIMDEFDFAMVKNIFDHNDWTYHGEFNPPSVGELRRSARAVLRGSLSSGFSSSGRFAATCIENADEKWLRLSLMFTPEEYGIDEGGTYE